MTINCLIVDDEKLAQEVLEHYLSKFDLLNLVGVCNNVFELLNILSKREVDLIFLDIKMPEIDGTDFVNMFKNPPAIIYTTAYNQYALEAFNQNAVDYLLKPISFDRFSKSIQKAQQLINTKNKEEHKNTALNPEAFYVKSEKRLVKINPIELICIEGMRNYVALFTESEKIIVHGTLNVLEENLAQFNFICRVHKSFFINLNRINYIEQNTAFLSNGKAIPIGLNYRNSVYEKLSILKPNKE